MRADPKPEYRKGNAPRREVDPAVLRRFHLQGHDCLVCGAVGPNADHLIPKGPPHFGDDDFGNLIPLCGSGTSGCHGAKHGSPYVDDEGRRITPEIVRSAIGCFLASPEGRRHRKYIQAKIGPGRDLDYMARHFDYEEA